MAVNKEMAEILGLSSQDASTLSGDTAQFQQNQVQGDQQGGMPPPQQNDFPTFRPQSEMNPLGLSEDDGPPQQYQQPEPQPQAPPPQQAQQTDGKPPMMVPNDRLTQEADRRREAEAKLRDIETQQKTMADRFAMMQEAFQENQRLQLEQTQKQTPPDPSEDIEGYIRYQEQQWKQENEGLRSELNQIKTQTQEQQIIGAINAKANADKWQFEQQAPDFQQAYSWWRNSQMAELDALGVPPAQATKHLDTMELQLSHAAQTRGANSAEAFYKAALARGWRSPQAAQQTQQQQVPAQDQTVTPIAQHPQYQPQAQPQPQYQQPTGFQQQQPHAQSLTNIQQGMQQSRSLDHVPPGASAVPMDLKTMAEMPEADFMRHYDQIVGKMRAVMG